MENNSVMDDLKKINNLWESKKKDNKIALEKLTEFMSEIKINAMGNEFIGKLPDGKTELIMFEDIDKMPLDEWIKKYFPIIFGFDKEIIENMNFKVKLELFKAYMEEYKHILSEKSFLD
ncbi:hypothetical protein [Methanococcus voltae]|uniref:Uncharacterized protein n=1 Tax=Methanococcus voltae TaxID=2188 RepID=A0A8J7RFS0_METVO|nr:hypothetical protein [Methanococcus voltae]MBP2172569.1 hypothetical protein [Methanococcus voltae]MBP2201524.1 hypothetical protein [Methanococcus voltae]